MTFTELLRALDRREVDELERVLQRAAAGCGATRDDAWAAMTELWHTVEAGERRTVDAWIRSIRSWLARPEGRSSLLAAAGLRRADHARARRDGTSCHEARHARLTEAWDSWHAGDLATPERPEPRTEITLGGQLLQLVAQKADADDAIRALQLSVAGLDDLAIARELGGHPGEMEALVNAGRQQALEAVSANAAFALRRVLGEDNDELAEASGLAAATVRMRVTRGCRELAAMVQAAIA